MRMSDFPGLSWSRFCAGGNCVLLAAVKEDGEESILVADSKTPDSPVLKFNRDEWDALLTAAQSGAAGYEALRSRAA